MSNLFQQEPDRSEVYPEPSVVGGQDAHVREAEDEGKIIIGGRAKTRLKFSFPVTADDVERAKRATDVQVSASSLHYTEMPDAIDRILAAAKMTNELPWRKLAFIRAMWVSYAINSASQAVGVRPSFRVKFDDHSESVVFGFLETVIIPLGFDARRFFRAAAPDVYARLKELFGNRGSLTENEEENVAVLERIAYERGVHRMPWYCFDTAEFLPAGSLSLSDRAIVKAASVRARTAGPNVVDALITEAEHVSASVPQPVRQSAVAPARAVSGVQY
jgi:hypothetical protein